ncbi:hypothetical protein CCZ01_07565 [Helicobacter monodelphidis]|uniref:hypothetical protein n=1 Tax=Helicobacter sp. 15-1451 TaxID=2004995 RepID=UPI000DCF2693|nr:hypothetical protein [Helicobacter sp. 15-1451]RAX57016.1 hypothetical protein CCZ01_07565 [Helicobacter sp. 15-1451]
MLISQVIAISGSILCNTPNITAVERFAFQADKVQRGDLFFAQNKKEIPKAIKKGAFGIFFEGEVEISDLEIAWLKTNSLQNVAADFVRYIVIDYAIDYIGLNPVSFHIAQKIIPPSKAFIGNSPLDILEQFSYIIALDRDEDKKKKTLFDFSPPSMHSKLIRKRCTKIPMLITDDCFLEKLSLTPSESMELVPVQLCPSSLFSSRIIFDGNVLSLMLSPLFLKNIQEVLSICKILKLDFKPELIRSIPFFQPYYLDNHYNLTEERTTSKVLIFAKDLKQFSQYQSFLEEHTKWAKKLYLTPTNKEGCISYNNISQLLEKIQQEFYHFMLILHPYQEEILKLLHQENVQEQTLF